MDNLDYDGYYEDVQPIDADRQREGVDTRLILRVVLLASLLCVALGRGKRWPWYLGCGVGCLLAWVGLVFVLGRTQLPSSLLPTGNIFACLLYTSPSPRDA